MLNNKDPFPVNTEDTGVVVMTSASSHLLTALKLFIGGRLLLCRNQYIKPWRWLLSGLPWVDEGKKYLDVKMSHTAVFPFPTYSNITWHVSETLHKRHEYTSDTHNSLRKWLSLLILLSCLSLQIRPLEIYSLHISVLLHSLHSTAAITNPKWICWEYATKGLFSVHYEKTLIGQYDTSLFCAAYLPCCPCMNQ